MEGLLRTNFKNCKVVKSKRSRHKRKRDNIDTRETDTKKRETAQTLKNDTIERKSTTTKISSTVRV